MREAAEAVAVMLSLFAPYCAEDMWATLGHDPTVALAGWPVVDESLLVEESVTAVVQVAGKVRARLTVPPDVTAEELQRDGAGGSGGGAGAGRALGPDRGRAAAEAGERRPRLTPATVLAWPGLSWW